ncbi:uncharacterized protein BO96DRAFT_333488 [Aspergillus niger CBS 101883]|uniref:Uncharacterized protein n=2 Tax=Aspergillus niger TaxID=5061 RepID=A2Q9Z7_ASPNC|nr:uncharacterized protein BO96DRAFT_333488 [Aspergillus niger CBS 101883]XP_059599714.1 hypothetical protein An01g09660 [Aspergillus niger]PYH58286.1 hypothetical protein BO96DRAFT_333488 [Aspergillus niger CBS 101883]CAK37149.1 hypothetical protein An01g09660 [Aspergillus niger]
MGYDANSNQIGLDQLMAIDRVAGWNQKGIAVASGRRVEARKSRRKAGSGAVGGSEATFNSHPETEDWRENPGVFGLDGLPDRPALPIRNSRSDGFRLDYPQTSTAFYRGRPEKEKDNLQAGI